MYRLILRLRIVYRRNERGGSTECCVSIDRNGCSMHKNLCPRPPKRRVVDLRVGDQFMNQGRWETVLKITCDGEYVLTDEQAAEHVARTDKEANSGWLVKAPAGYATQITSGGLRRDGR